MTTMYYKICELRSIYGWVPGPAGQEADLEAIQCAFNDGIIEKPEYQALKRLVQFEYLQEAA